MTRTYLDAGVLIAAVRRDERLVDETARLFADPDRAFVWSAFVRLEVLPKAIYRRRHDEFAWYESFFAAVIAWAEITPGLVEQAEQEADRHGLNALDALHVAAAAHIGADEPVTTERRSRPIHRTTSVSIVRR